MSEGDSSLRVSIVRSEIRDTLARLAWLADHGEPAEYAKYFSEDAVWEIVASADMPIPAETIRGREAIEAGSYARRASGVQGPGSGTAHAISTTSIEVSGSRAIARSLFMFYGGLDGTPILTALGRYTDTFVEQADGSWLLSHRSITRE